VSNAGTVTIDFAAETAKFTAELQKVNKRLKGMEDDFASFGKVVKSVSGVFAGFLSTQAIISFAKQTFEAADAIGTAAEKAGVSVEAFSRLKFAAEQADVEFASFSTGIKELQKTLSLAGAGSESARKELAGLGLEASALRGLGLEEQLGRIADAFKNITDPADQTRIAVELFGKAGTDLIPFLNKGSEGIRQLTAEADRLGITLSTQTAQGIDAADRAIKKLNATIAGFGSRALGTIAIGIVGTDDPTLILEQQIRDLERAKAQISASGTGIGGGSIVENAVSDLEARIAGARQQIELVRSAQAQLEQSNASEADRRKLLADIDAFNRETARLQQQVDEDAAREAEKRAKEQADAARQSAIEAEEVRAAIASNELEDQLDRQIRAEASQQQHLDTLLQQQVEHAQETLQVEADSANLIATVRRNLGLQEITFEEIKRATLLDIAAMTFTGLAGLSKKFARIQQAIAAGEVIVSTAKNIAKAFPNFALMAKAALVGAVQLAKIRSVSFDNPSASIGVGAGGSAVGGLDASQAQETVAEGANNRAQTNIYINGYIGRDQMNQMVDLIRSETDRDVTLFGASTRQAFDLQPA